jgi:hypothetical protein
MHMDEDDFKIVPCMTCHLFFAKSFCSFYPCSSTTWQDIFVSYICISMHNTRNKAEIFEMLYQKHQNKCVERSPQVEIFTCARKPLSTSDCPSNVVSDWRESSLSYDNRKIPPLVQQDDTKWPNLFNYYQPMISDRTRSY